MKSAKQSLAEKYDVDARDLYFTQKQKIVSDDSKVRDVLENSEETIYLVKRKSSSGAAGTATENEEPLPRVEENISPELRSSKPFAVRVTVCNNEMKGKAVVVENVRPDTTIDEFAERALEALNVPVGWISIVSETGTKHSGTWRRGRFELWESSEEKYVSKLTYCGQKQASSSTPSSSSTSSNVGSEAAEQNGSQTLTLQIEYGQGNKLFIEAEKEMLVEELKKILEPEVVYLVLRLRGGRSCPSHAFVDVTNTDALVERSFSSIAPPWRVVERGISVEGICENEGCPAFKKQVICRWGMKAFDLHGGKPFCPCCLKQIVPLKPGFYDCRWRISSVKEDGTRMQMPWKEAGNEKYTTYDEKEAGTAKFVLLQIEALPRGRVEKHPTLPYDVAVPEVCGICHKWQFNGSVQIYKCGHSFHRNCGSDWEETVGECPICQMKMKDQTT
ncbi:putative ubiquitin domain containing protein [Monocercomonoides exilis]|uniref:putative ubiquitin domain containing protein n=1 Tax=Monocercomonoides exilis TaxID=2049356 RepID=UPI0035599C90|nr:putative ubiquitin domain containing protein [Monocercomonoides exilis]|eukprot:MONOS_9488.1-p1 / transcript=MONOS_9488.1 / gene=MONOS_9488 / organism=Monocercomonoides_exilis_PA203 / gene_product=ubiquitin domain containing protein / transcript_product=ubiquitin domain containing protein / location=Mono_scaffold00394:6286-8058(-) / protein_length=445 / sequence_SO=supercontig / SO=protein_coding / is_pseudo=false